MEYGEFYVDADEPIDGRPSLHWHESELAIDSGTNLLRFFIGVATEQAEMPVRLRIATPSAPVEFASTVTRTQLV